MSSPPLPSADRYARYAAAAVAGLFTAVTIRYSSFIAVISDGSGYVSQAHRWLDGRLFGPLGLFHLPAWSNEWLEIPLGYRPGSIAATDVFTYPPGLPLIMAAAIAIAGDWAAYVVPPLLGGVAVWATGELSHRLGGPLARVLGAALMATSAIALSMAVDVMSDVPAAALWALALALAVRGCAVSAVASGLLVAMAILTRPNLAPLALFPWILAVASPVPRRVVRGIVFAAAALVGPLTLLVMQGILYESWLSSGHLGIGEAFSLSNVASNVSSYPRWYWQTHTPAIGAAVTAPVLLWYARDQVNAHHRSRFALAPMLLVFSVGVYTVYLPYTPYEEWHYLRFMLPALPPLYALTAASLAYGIERLNGTARWAAFAVVTVMTAGLQARSAKETQFTESWRTKMPVLQAARYLESALPPNAMVMTLFHSGTVRAETGRVILRPDFIPPQQLDAMVRLAEQYGYDLYVLLDEELERDGFNALWAPHTKLLKLDWPPRARIGAHGRLNLYRADDAHHWSKGEIWPVDSVR